MKHFFSLLSLCLCFEFVQAQIPQITAVNPLLGYRGSNVNVTGSNFDGTPDHNIVYFGSVRGNITAATGSSLTVTIPPNATYSSLTVTTGGLTASSALPFIATYPSSGEITSSTFGARINFATQDQPGRMAQGDLTGDGKIDLIASNWVSNTLSVYRNISTVGSLTTGSFDAPKIYNVGRGPNEVAIGDIDGDGKLDMVVCNIDDHTLSVFRNNSAGDTLSFETSITLTTDMFPFDVAMKDLDGDGKPEIISANIAASTISVFRNASSTGNINFASRINYSTPANPTKIAVGDLNSDGKPDLVVTSSSSAYQALSIFPNISTTGSINFGTRQHLSSPGKLWGAVLSDIDLDGRLDVAAVTDSSSNLMVVYQNTSIDGSVSFNEPVAFERGNGYGFLTVGDLNGDGRPEVITANGTSNTLSIFRNTSTSGVLNAGSFSSKVDYPTGIYPHTPAIGDFDNDGHADIAFVNNGKVETPDNTLSIMRNEILEVFNVISIALTSGNNQVDTIRNILGEAFVVTLTDTGGHRAIGVPVDFSIMSAPSGATGQILSVVSAITDSLGQASSILTLGNKAGTYTIRASSTGISRSPVTFTAMAVHGKATSLALKSGNAQTYSINEILPNPLVVKVTDDGGNPLSNVHITFLISDTPSAAIGHSLSTTSGVTDTNGELSTTLKLGNLPGTYTVKASSDGLIGSPVLFSVTAIVISNAPSITSINPLSGYRGMSLTVTGSYFNEIPASNIVYLGSVRANVVSGTTSVLNVTVPWNATYAPLTITTNGLTGSSTLPFRTTFSSDSMISSSSLEQRIDFLTGEGPEEIAQGDFTGDGKIDLVVPNFYSSTMSVFRNISTKGFIASNSFDAAKNYATGNNPMDVAVGDLDGDGKLDIVVANIGSTNLSVFRNITEGDTISFASQFQINSDAAPYGVTIVDLNRDGKPEVISSNYGGGTVSIFRNTSTVGSISFAPRIDRQTPLHPETVAAGDLDGDGLPDLIIGAEGDVSVLPNTSTYFSISFGTRIDLSISGPVWGATIGDLDVDGKLDIIGTAKDNEIFVLRNICSPANFIFSSVVTFLKGSGEGLVSIGDLNGDGRPELVVPSSDDNLVSVLRNMSSPGSIQAGSFADRISFLTGTRPYSSAVGDYDNDGHPDIAVVNYGSSESHGNTMSVFRNAIPEIYKIVSVASPNGSLLPSDTTYVYHGLSVIFTMVPDSGCHLDSLKVDGVKKDSITGYTFSNVTENHTISAYFSKNAPLPVQLTSFNGSLKGTSIELIWKTATEIDNYGFEVERRQIPDGGVELEGSSSATLSQSQRWIKRGFVQGHGTSNSPHEYSFTDSQLQPGRYTYRLKQIDQSGLFMFSQSLEIENNFVPRILTLSQNYPNPFNPTTTINFTLAQDGRISLNVFDMLGREVETLIDANLKAGKLYTVQFNASDLSSGMYFYRLLTSDKSIVKKLMFLK
jgi:hypothetical protein